MTITSLVNSVKRRRNQWLYDFFTPSIRSLLDGDAVLEYEVQKDQTMRIDLVILAMYNDDRDRLADMDIILWINGIDNPLNIYPGMKLLYPDPNSLEDFRILRDDSTALETKKALGVPNKSSRKDSNRQKYLDSDYSLPPTVRSTPVDPVRLTIDSRISVGGV